MSEGLRSDLRAPKSLRMVALRQTRAGRLGLLVVLGVVLSPYSAHAYVDPGSTGFIITTVLGAIAAAGYLIRGWIAAIGRWLRGLRGESPNGCSSTPCDAEHPPGSSEAVPATTLVRSMKIRASEGSFKDPTGRVYHVAGEHGERIVRGLTQDGSATLTKLLAEQFFQSMMSRGDVVGTHSLGAECPYARPIIEAGWHSGIEHEAVDFVSWPYEWPFSMLKDAALLQLSLLEESIAHGWTLKDATPFNVQWRGARPTFVDVPSFVLWDGGYWRAYRQFCATFLAPLLLTAHLGIPFQPLLRSRLEGLPPEEAARYFRGLSRFRRGVPSHILFPAMAERMSRRAAPTKSRQRQSETMLRALIDSLRRLIAGLSCRRTLSAWARYADSHSYGADEGRKKRFVGEQAAALQPALVWDLGANTGAMARIAAQSADTVIALDSDHGVVETLYQSLLGVGEPQNIVPLVMDVANPSPAQGWGGRERAAFDGRRSPDLVLCLALIHHLRVAANIPVALLLDWLRSLRAVVVIEFVDRADEMFQKLLENKDEPYPDYTAENFNCEVARRFDVRQRLQLKDGRRELLVLEPR